MTRRLEERLSAAGRSPGPNLEIAYHPGEDHLLSSQAENVHHEGLVAFLTRHLSPG